MCLGIIDPKMVASFMGDETLFALYKGVADNDGMLMFGIKDAAHLIAVVEHQGEHVRKLGEFMGARQAIDNAELSVVIEDAVGDANVSPDTLKGMSGEIQFSWNDDGEIVFKIATAHADLPDESTHLKARRNGNGKGRKPAAAWKKGEYRPLAKSHGNANKLAYFVLKSLGHELEKPIIDGEAKSPLYRDDNLAVLIDKTAKLRKECGYDREVPSTDGEDSKEKRLWVALLNQTLAKHHGQEIKCWQK